MSRSFFTEQMRDEDKAAEYRCQADEMRTKAADLTHFADELVTENYPLHDSSPRRRAGLAAAAAFRQAANAYTDSAEQYESWAADLEHRAAS